MSDDTFSDLDAVAAHENGTLRRFGPVWSYPGAPPCPSGDNLRLPLDSVPDARVRAALAAGAWVAADVDPVTMDPLRNNLPVILAVIKVPTDAGPGRARVPAEYGQA